MSGCGDCSDTSKLIDSLKGCVDEALSVQDCIGATLHKVYILTRTWTGERPGDGTASETLEQIKPSPQIKEYAHDLRITEGGAIRQGDIVLKNISKSYTEKQIDCSTDTIKTEKFYFINDRQYAVIHVKENLLTWDVHLRKRSDETRGGQ